MAKVMNQELVDLRSHCNMDSGYLDLMCPPAGRPGCPAPNTALMGGGLGAFVQHFLGFFGFGAMGIGLDQFS
jgi:hypothetical protein